MGKEAGKEGSKERREGGLSADEGKEKKHKNIVLQPQRTLVLPASYSGNNNVTVQDVSVKVGGRN